MYPMTCESLDDLAERAQAGDRAAAEAVAAGVWRLAYSVAGRFQCRGLDTDDLAAEALACVPRCLAKWDRSRKTFAGYFYAAAWNALVKLRRRERRAGEAVAKFGRHLADRSRTRCGNSASGDPAGGAAADLAEMLAALPPELREVVELRRGLTGRAVDIREAARRMRVPVRVAQALHHAAMNELRDRFGE